MRCFVAIDLPPDVRAAVAAAQARLRDAAPRADARWVASASLHLTLRFLGEVSDVDPVRDVLVTVAARHAPFDLAAGGLGAFPGIARPRTLWAGISGGIRELGLLAVDVERSLEPLGFPPEPRPFRGHLTLARVRSPRGIGRIAPLVTGDRPVFGAWTASELVLYRSHLRPTGSIYEALSRLPLGG
ncbi:MAG TPA: RNA 2',3'-cyclic phosphodiesterase [Candidatus Binatia bacterium]|jgi:2'-5' RNA ligase|nr:RNA 2',3'-cyclic phosphodiesterase [Candidatus Binatia bacterium]